LAFNKHVKIFTPWEKHKSTPIFCGMPQIFGANIAILFGTSKLFLFFVNSFGYFNEISYLCTTRTRQASPRRSNVRVVFILENDDIRCYEKGKNDEVLPLL
jgi:hypothetical protein